MIVRMIRSKNTNDYIVERKQVFSLVNEQISCKKEKEKEKAVKDQRKIARIKNKIVRFYVDLYLFIVSVLTDCNCSYRKPTKCRSD